MAQKTTNLHSIFLKLLLVKLILPSIVIGFVLMGLSAFYNISVVMHDQYLFSKFISSDIDNFLSDSTRSIMAISSIIQERDPDKINHQLETTYNSDPYFHSLLVLDEGKQVVSFYPPEAYAITAIVNRLPIFDQSESSTPIISPPFFSSLPGRPTAFIPIHQKGSGWLIGEIFFDVVENMILHPPAPLPKRLILLTDTTGHVLVTSNPDWVKVNQSISHANIINQTNENSSLSIFNNQWVFVNIEPLQYAGWQFRVYYPLSDAIGDYLIIAAIIAVILLVVWALVIINMRGDFSKRIYDPLAQFNQYIKSISMGDLSEKTRPIRVNAPFTEIKNISDSFEDMSKTVFLRQQALLENEQKYRLLIEQSSDAIYLEQDGIFLVVNQKFTDLFGDLAQSQEPSSGLHRIASKSDLIFIQEQQLRMLNGEVSNLRFEFVAMDKNKSEIIVEVATSVFLYREHLAIQGIIRDISERKRVEKSEHDQRMLAEALRDTASVLTSTLNLEEVIDRILNNIEKVVPCYALNIMLVDNDTQLAKVIASKGYAERNIEEWLSSITLSIVEVSNLRFMFETGQPIVIPDTHQNSLWNALKPSAWIASYAGAPIKVQGKVIGFINLDSPEVNFFAIGQAQRLQSFADQAGIAIHNAQLLRDLSLSNQELTAAYETTLQGWSKALELRDYETQGHTLRVLDLTIRLAQKLEITEPELTHIRYGVLLHDIGKIGISDNILFKNGPLNSYEWEIMRQHPNYAFEMLSPIKYLADSLDIPYCHHEWWNGTGYPRGLSGEAIPLAARIFSVVDVWDALTSDRPYHQGMPGSQVIKHLLEQTENQLDPRIVRIFVDMISTEFEISES